MDKPETINERAYSEEYKQELLNDLRLIGDRKPLGYLPKETLVDICGVKPEDIKKELEDRGLVVLDLTYQESNVSSGAIFAYSEQALNRVLQSGKSILERNGWPTTPNEFVCHLKVFAEDPDLYKLVMQAFADPRLREK